EVLADAETGILLRYAELSAGRMVHLAELSEVRFGLEAGDLGEPDADAEDDGSGDGEPLSSLSSMFSGPGWTAAKAAANVAGNVLGLNVRHASRRPGEPGSWERATTEDDPEAAMPPAGDRFDPAVSGGPASDDVLHALHRSGRAEFSATLHWWADAERFGER